MKIKEFGDLHALTTRFAGLDPQRLATLREAGETLEGELDEVVAEFYTALQAEPEMGSHLPGSLDHLKQAQRDWLQRVFFGAYDQDHAQALRQIGLVHFAVELPLEFMGLGMNRMRAALQRRLVSHYADRPDRLPQVLEALQAALDHNLLMMEYSYIESAMAGELEDFLEITGMSRDLFNNLAQMNR
jgi:truncated hemoglobin YjbI